MGSSVITAESLHTLECAPTSEDRALPACFLTVCHHLHEAKLEQVYFWGADVLTPWQIQPGLDEIRLHLLFALSPSGYTGQGGGGDKFEIAKFFMQAAGHASQVGKDNCTSSEHSQQHQ